MSEKGTGRYISHWIDHQVHYVLGAVAQFDNTTTRRLLNETAYNHAITILRNMGILEATKRKFEEKTSIKWDDGLFTDAQIEQESEVIDAEAEVDPLIQEAVAENVPSEE